MRILFAVGVIVALLASAADAGAFQVHSDELAFTLEVPEGFHEYDYLRPHSDARSRRFVEHNTLFAFNQGGDPQENNYTGIFLSIERSEKGMLTSLGGDDVSSSVADLNASWKGRGLQVHRVERQYTTLGDRMVTLTAAIPLAPEPIQIKVSGDIRDEAQMRGLLRKVLASIDGEVGLYAYLPWLKTALIAVLIAWIGLRLKRAMA